MFNMKNNLLFFCSLFRLLYRTWMEKGKKKRMDCEWQKNENEEMANRKGEWERERERRERKERRERREERRERKERERASECFKWINLALFSPNHTKWITNFPIVYCVQCLLFVVQEEKARKRKRKKWNEERKDEEEKVEKQQIVCCENSSKSLNENRVRVLVHS